MNKFGKATLMAGASALALGLATSQASAFQDVDWEWDVDINEKINIKITENFKLLDPRGLVQVELLQISIGDIEAESIVNDIKNDPGFTYGESREVWLDGYTTGSLDVSGYTTGYTGVKGTAKGKIDVKGYAKDECWWGYRGKKCDYDPVKAHGYAELGVYGQTTGSLGVHGYTDPNDYLGVTVHGYLPVIDQRPWEQLPTVVSSATAIANISTVEGNSAVFVHDGQFSMGDVEFDFGDWKNDSPSAASNGSSGSKGRYWHYDPEDNEHVDLASILLVGAALGLVESADIEATSEVYDIYNAKVDSSATAIANVHSIDVNADLATDVMVIADLVQFQYGDITAESNVYDINIIGYGNNGLPGIDAPVIVNSVATAIGNVSTVTVNVGDVVEP